MNIPQPQSATLTLNDAIQDAFAPIPAGGDGYATGDILPTPQSAQQLQSSDGVELTAAQYQVRIVLHCYTYIHTHIPLYIPNILY